MTNLILAAIAALIIGIAIGAFFGRSGQGLPCGSAARSSSLRKYATNTYVIRPK